MLDKDSPEASLRSASQQPFSIFSATDSPLQVTVKEESALKKADEKFLRRRSHLTGRTNFLKHERPLSHELRQLALACKNSRHGLVFGRVYLAWKR